MGLRGGSGGFMSTPGLAGQRQAGGFHRVVLHMEQIGRMVGTEVLFGVRINKAEYCYLTSDFNTKGSKPALYTQAGFKSACGLINFPSIGTNTSFASTCFAA